MAFKIKLFLCAVFAFAVFANAAPSESMPLPASVADSLPWFAVREIKESETPFTRGHLETLAAKNDRIALVYFATWCIPCRVGVKKLAENQQALKENNLSVVLVNIGEKEKDKILSWVENLGASNFMLIGDPFRRLTEGFGLVGEEAEISLPRTIVIDRNLKPLFMIGQEGDDWPQVLWKK